MTIDARKIIDKLGLEGPEPEKVRISLYVDKETYAEMKGIVGKAVSSVTEELWEQFINSYQGEPKKKGKK